MTKEQAQIKLAAIHNGAYTNVTFMSDIAVNKDNKEHRVQKVVSAVCRFGVCYSHINVEPIQSRVTSGEYSGELPWGEWDIDCPYLIWHKENYYLRCTVSRSPNHHRKVTYLIDGKEATKEEAMKLTRASEWTKPATERYIFDLKLVNVLSLGKEG